MSNILPYTMYYENSAGKILRLDTPPFVSVGGEQFNSGWKTTVVPRQGRSGGRLISRRRQCEEKKLKISVSAPSAIELSNALDEMMDIFTADVEEMTAGRLWVNNRYLRCYCIADTRSMSENFTSIGEVSLIVLAEDPVWCSEESFTFFPSGEGPQGQSGSVAGHKYLYRYPFRYTALAKGLKVVNKSSLTQPMRIEFFGPCVNPSVIVAGHEIGVMVTLSAGEFVVINQQTKEIYKMTASGEKVNLFAQRIKNGSVFESLPAGTYYASLLGGGSMRITVITQKGAPLWSI